MKEVIHRLLLFIVWGCTALFCFILYHDFKYGETSVIDTVIEHYPPFVYAILVAYVLSISVNWIMTGDRNNWARKPEPSKREFNDDEDYFV